MREISEREIAQWSKKSAENAKIVEAYMQAKEENHKAFMAKDGARSTGWAARQHFIHEHIRKQLQ